MIILDSHPAMAGCFIWCNMKIKSGSQVIELSEEQIHFVYKALCRLGVWTRDRAARQAILSRHELNHEAGRIEETQRQVGVLLQRNTRKLRAAS